MIDVSKAKPATTDFEVIASDRIYEELGNNTYSFVDVISELIDNSLAARIDGEKLHIVITIGLADQIDKTYLEIRDDASGISLSDLGDAISPAGMQHHDSLNEHGLGMKQAVASLGKLQYLVTKTINDKEGHLIEKFAFGKHVPKLVPLAWKHGTEIRVGRLRPIVPRNQNHFTRDVVDLLGARYRRFLRPDDAMVSITLKLVDADDGSAITEYKIRAVRPTYFHPNTRDNKPVVEKYRLSGKGWQAELTFGYAPSDKEYRDLGIEVPTKFAPYHVSLKNQGLDIILHDRIIQFHMLSEIGLVPARHNSLNSIRGELDLRKGFSTAITKNAMLQDAHFKECIDEVQRFLENGKYLERITYPDELPEELLRDRIVKWMKSNKLAPKRDVKTEYAIQALGGSVDIMADGEPWEIKRGDPNGVDVYQLFAYMDMGNFNKGYLVAKSFSTGAQSAADHIKKNHKRQIDLIELESLPVLGPMTKDERETYY